MPECHSEQAGILRGRSYRSAEGPGICRDLPRSNFNNRSKILIWVRKEARILGGLMNRQKWRIQWSGRLGEENELL